MHKLDTNRISTRLKLHYIETAATTVIEKDIDDDNNFVVRNILEQALQYKAKMSEFYARTKDQIRLGQMYEARRSLHIAHQYSIRVKNMYSDPVTGNILREAERG